jgi:hypothetical protein
LVPPPGREERSAPPLVPLTRRAELAQGEGTGGPRTPRRGFQAGGDFYVLASERSGQPQPPSQPAEEPPGAEDELDAARMMIGLSGA